MSRRSVVDPLEPTSEPHWYAVREGFGGLLEVRLLASGTNLMWTFVTAMLESMDAGWELGDFSSRGGACYCTRGTQRATSALRGAIRDSPVDRSGDGHRRVLCDD